MRLNLYNTNFEAAAVVFLFILLLYIRHKYYNKDRINQGLRRLVTAQLISTILDLATSVTITFSDVVNPVFNQFINTIYFMSIGVTACLFAMYVFAFAREDKHYWRVVFIANLVLIGYFAVLIVNMFKGFVFNFDDGYYKHGNLYLVCFIVPAVFFVIDLMTIIALNKTMDNKIRITLFMLVILAASGEILQITVFPDVLLSNATPALAMVLGLMTLISPNYAELTRKEDELRTLSSNLEERIKEETQKILDREKKGRELSDQVVNALATVIDASNQGTNSHAYNVARISRMIAEKLGIDKESAQKIFYMAIVHDIGAIGLGEDLVNKKGLYTEEERELMHEHTVIGAHILEKITEIPNIGTAARWHHERFDGEGYPDHMKGTAIPIEARIVAVADSLDAMVSPRSYKEMMTLEEASEEIKRCKGSQFDPKVADAAIALIGSGAIGEIYDKY